MFFLSFLCNHLQRYICSKTALDALPEVDLKCRKKMQIVNLPEMQIFDLVGFPQPSIWITHGKSGVDDMWGTFC
jgi:hypothetical protein